MVRVSWPKTADQPYEVTVETASGDTGAAQTDGGGEFSRFEKLTAKLVKVAKSELNEKREKS